MRRWLVCIGAVLVVLGCAGPVRQVIRPGDLSVPKQLQTRQVIVTLAPDTPERWASLTQALASAARQRGVEIRLNSPVARILTRDGRVTGVALEDGMILCVETPYYQISWGGMMVEDMIVVRPTGIECLTHLPRELRRV